MDSEDPVHALNLEELYNEDHPYTTSEIQSNIQNNDENISLSHNKILSTKLKENAKKLLESLSTAGDKLSNSKDNKNQVRFVPVVFPLKYLNNTYNFNRQDENQRKSFNLHLISNDREEVEQKLHKLLVKQCDPKIYNDQRIVQKLIDQVIFNYNNPTVVPQLQKKKFSSSYQSSELLIPHGPTKAWDVQMEDRQKNIQKFKERQQRVLNNKRQSDQLKQKTIEKKQQEYSFKPQIHKMSKQIDNKYKQAIDEYQNNTKKHHDQQNLQQATAVNIQINTEKEKQALESRKRQFKKMQQQLQDRMQKIEKNFEAFQNLMNQKNAYDLNEFVNHIYNKQIFFKYLLRQEDGQQIMDLINYESIPQSILNILHNDKQTQLPEEPKDSTQDGKKQQKDDLQTFTQPLLYIQERYNKLNANEDDLKQDDIYQIRKVIQIQTLFENVTDQYFKYMAQKQKEIEEFEKAQGEKPQYQIQTFIDSDKTFLERVEIHIAEKKRMMKNCELQKKQQEMRECTFSPEITDRAKKVQQPLDDHGNPVTVFDKLYTEAKASKILENQDIKTEIEKQMESLREQQLEASRITDQSPKQTNQNFSSPRIKDIEHHDQTGAEIIDQFYQDLRISNDEANDFQKSVVENESIENIMF